LKLPIGNRQLTIASVAPHSKEQQLRLYYRTLYEAWGRQHWWPGRTRFEVIVGAYLTQNTAWSNVELALRSLRGAGVLSVKGIRETPLPKLQKLIRSSGYFRQKARCLKGFVKFLDKRYAGSLDRMFAAPTGKLRAELLALNGIGPETADSILLYAGQRPVFVVDAYTRRVLDRHGILPANAPYEEIRALFERALAEVPWDAAQLGTENREQTTKLSSSHLPSPMSLVRRSAHAQVYNEMHGLIVGVGKHFCSKTKPKCDECPLQDFLPKVK
jgi:endonuclease III related protein